MINLSFKCRYETFFQGTCLSLKNVISTVANENQGAYDFNRFISEGGRLVLGILDITNSLDSQGFLMTAYIEKAFDSLNHSFLLCVLEKFGLRSEFIKWIKILIKNLESCVINDGKSTPYFRLERRIIQ